MANVSISEITQFIEDHIPGFHQKRLKSLAGLKLKKVLQRKNPYYTRQSLSSVRPIWSKRF
jgi:hypothetical protein